MTHNSHSIPHCGECPNFLHEDTDGYGFCRIINREQRCSDPCHFSQVPPSKQDTINLLHHFQKWRRGGKENMPAPWLVGIAIDNAIKHLRKL